MTKLGQSAPRSWLVVGKMLPDDGNLRLMCLDGPEFGPDKIRLVEASAYEAVTKERDFLKKENAQLIDEMAFIKNYEDERDQLKKELAEAKAEIERLNVVISKDIEYYSGMIKAGAQEITKLKDENKNAQAIIKHNHDVAVALGAENAALKESLKMACEAMEMGAFHHQSCDANWYSSEVDEDKVRAGIPDPRKAKHCICARKKIETALTQIKERHGKTKGD